jgi:hypothetical protein
MYIHNTDKCARFKIDFFISLVSSILVGFLGSLYMSEKHPVWLVVLMGLFLGMYNYSSICSPPSITIQAKHLKINQWLIIIRIMDIYSRIEPNST